MPRRVNVAEMACASVFMFINLDEFKGLDDTPSHDIRDEVLRIVADRVRRCMRENEPVARLGEDEFAVLLDPLLDETNPKTAAEGILAIFREPLVIRGGAVRVTPSIGIAIFPDNASDSDALLRCAAAAMISAKSQGQNNCGVYVSQDQPFGAQFSCEAPAKRH